MLPRVRYLKAETAGQVLDLLEEHGPEARILAGGTDLLISMCEGTTSSGLLVDIKNIPDLRTISLDAEGRLVIGACVTMNELHESGILPPGMQAIREAVSRLATYQIRNRATVGGNLCNASPACDLGPPLLVLGANVRLLSRNGERLVALQDFFTGVKATCCGPCEFLTAVVVPQRPGTVSAFLKRGRIKGHDLATVNAAAAWGEGGLKVALGAVSATPVLIDTLDGIGLGDKQKVTEMVLKSIAPIDDVRGSRLYRRHMVRFLVGEVLDLLKDRKQEEK